MPIRKPPRQRLRSLCAEVHPDDGSDPRYFFRNEQSSKALDRKAYQLSRQVFEVLEHVFAGQAGNANLSELAVVAVDPAPDSAHLLVTVTARTSEVALDPSSILASLHNSAGWLRSEVATAITRKRAPLLSYRVVEIRSPPPARSDHSDSGSLRPGSDRIS